MRSLRPHTPGSRVLHPVDLGPRASHSPLFKGPRGGLQSEDGPLCLGQLLSGGQTSRADSLQSAVPESFAEFSVSLTAGS